MDAKDAPEGGAKRVTDISVVAEDKNWRRYVAKELKEAEKWHSEWGFMAAGAIEEGKEPKMKTREDRIGELETQFKKMEARNYVTSNMKIGRGENLEMFQMTHLNI